MLHKTYFDINGKEKQREVNALKHCSLNKVKSKEILNLSRDGFPALFELKYYIMFSTI